MKWRQYKDTACQVDLANRLIKADNINQLPESMRICCFVNGFNHPDYECIGYSRALYESPYTDRKTGEKECFPCLEFRNGSQKTVISESMIKRFIQKTSKFYVGSNNAPVCIVNRNYCIVAAPAIVDYRLKSL